MVDNKVASLEARSGIRSKKFKKRKPRDLHTAAPNKSTNA